MATKRSREELLLSHHITTVANGLFLLSAAASSGGGGQNSNVLTTNGGDEHIYGRVFECKTCNRQFSSFQALGGHRASHKRPRTAAAGDVGQVSPPSPAEVAAPRAKTHECSICGVEFAIGQALGGHMRRHRAAGDGGDGGAPVIKKPSRGRRVWGVDLNLTPLENDMEFIKLGIV